ncbi:hypothetical protein N0V90_004864 [Kalmusia sp. IMI 367209]|nr:hypothetical protein N0V90_004864 [Kalmusia sp. IMI 367209]
MRTEKARSATRSSTSEYSVENGPFLWSYSYPADGIPKVYQKDNIRDLDLFASSTGDTKMPELLFLAGHPSPGWLNAVGHKYTVDPHFFQRHMNFQPNEKTTSYAEPALPSDSRHILRLNVPTIGHIEPEVQTSLENMQLTRQQLLIWTDAGGVDRDPELPLSDLTALEHNYAFEYQPTILNCPNAEAQHNSIIWGAPAPSFKTTQTFNILHRIYGESLDPKIISQDPFYGLNEIYSFAAAAENQFLNMMEQILLDRMELATLRSSEIAALDSSAHIESLTFDIQFDRNILDAHRVRLNGTVAFLQANDDPIWFPRRHEPLPADLIDKVTAANLKLLRDFQHLAFRVETLIDRSERVMEMVANNANLTESKRSFLQADGLAKLTRLTTIITILYVPLSFVCSLFGMNFKQFGQGDLSLWVWGAVSVPIILISLFFLRHYVDFRGLV